jgi:hypothetical protein
MTDLIKRLRFELGLKNNSNFVAVRRTVNAHGALFPRALPAQSNGFLSINSS